VEHQRTGPLVSIPGLPGLAGLAAQPLPRRPDRGRACLRPGRATGQRQRRRHPVGDHLAVAAQSLHPPPAWHAHPRSRSGPPAGHRRRPPAQQPATPPLDPVFVALNPGALPAHERSPAELFQSVRREEQYATLAPTWWSSCTAKATPARPPPGHGRSFAGPTAATDWPANAPAVPSAATADLGDWFSTMTPRVGWSRRLSARPDDKPSDKADLCGPGLRGHSGRSARFV
jgi:hypothetical protein